MEKLLRTVLSLALQQKMVVLVTISLVNAIIYHRASIVLVAKFVHDILEVF
jgi:hypothetical protein